MQSGAHQDDEIITRHRGLVGRAVLVSGLTFLSRILGFVRETIMAAVFGDGSAISDAFFTAWRVPNLFRRLFGEGALSTSLQTAMTEADGDRGRATGARIFRGTLRLTFWILLGVTVLVLVAIHFMPDVMPLTGWPWLGADPEPVRDLSARLFPFVILICLAALCGGALNVRGHYAAPNLAPTVMNAVWIVALIGIGIAFGWGASAEGSREEVLVTQWAMARALTWGVLIGGVLQLLMQVPALYRNGLLEPVATGEAGESDGVHRPWVVLKQAAPLALGAAVYQINVMIDGLMAEGLLSDGGPTALYYANRVQQFPLALVAIATVNAVFPSLKALGHRGRLEEMRALHDRSQLGVVFLALPSAVGLWLLAGPMATVIFEHGNYGEAGVARVASALRMLALALVPAGSVALVGRAYFARGDFTTPVKVSIAALVANVLLNALFVVVFDLDVAGLALATALCSWGSLVVLLPGLHRRLGLPSSSLRITPRLARVVAASAVAGLGAWGANALLAARWHSALGLSGASIAGIVGYLAAARLLRVPEWEELRARLRRQATGPAGDVPPDT